MRWRAAQLAIIPLLVVSRSLSLPMGLHRTVVLVEARVELPGNESPKRHLGRETGTAAWARPSFS